MAPPSDPSGDNRFDGIFATITEQAQGIEPLLDSFFGFLQRKTDFFTDAENQDKCKELVTSAFDKHRSLALVRKQEVKQRSSEADAERRKRLVEQKLRDEQEFRRRQEELASRPKIEELSADELQEEKKAEAPQKFILRSKVETCFSQPDAIDQKSAAASLSPAKDAKEEEDEENDDSPPPAGNGGTTDKYTWTQTLSCVEVQIPIPPGIKSKDCIVEIGGNSVKVGVKGKPLILDGKYHCKVKADDSLWTLVDNKMIQLNLEKVDGMRWWSCVMEGDPEIDTKKIVPENSKLSDLDPETRTTVEKMMFDQRQKAAGKPTSDQLKQSEMLDKFKAAHPEMDFSNAKINWGGNAFG